MNFNMQDLEAHFQNMDLDFQVPEAWKQLVQTNAFKVICECKDPEPNSPLSQLQPTQLVKVFSRSLDRASGTKSKIMSKPDFVNMQTLLADVKRTYDSTFNRQAIEVDNRGFDIASIGLMMQKVFNLVVNPFKSTAVYSGDKKINVRCSDGNFMVFSKDGSVYSFGPKINFRLRSMDGRITLTRVDVRGTAEVNDAANDAPNGNPIGTPPNGTPRGFSVGVSTANGTAATRMSGTSARKRRAKQIVIQGHNVSQDSYSPLPVQNLEGTFTAARGQHYGSDGAGPSGTAPSTNA